MDTIKKWLLSSFLSNWIRHGLTALGAVLIAKGLPSDMVQPWVEASINLLIQALPIIVALIWSMLEKRYIKAALPMK